MTGSVYVQQGATLTAPALTHISGHPLPDPAIAAQRLRDVASAALLAPDALEMRDWHSCGTTHCIGGWAIHQAGPDGYKLEHEVGSWAAGQILLGIEASTMFRASNEEARAWLKTKLEPEHPAPEAA